MSDTPIHPDVLEGVDAALVRAVERETRRAERAEAALRKLEERVHVYGVVKDKGTRQSLDALADLFDAAAEARVVLGTEEP